jgi:hypothetical protein
VYFALILRAMSLYITCLKAEDKRRIGGKFNFFKLLFKKNDYPNLIYSLKTLFSRNIFPKNTVFRGRGFSFFLFAVRLRI